MIENYDDEWLSELELVLLYLEDCSAHCDEMTYLISYILKKEDIPHQCLIGHVLETHSGDVVTPHCWIELNNSAIIDLRLRMWLGDYDHVPHGVFKRQSHSSYQYNGKPISPPLLTEYHIEMISEGLLSHVKVPQHS